MGSVNVITWPGKRKVSTRSSHSPICIDMTMTGEVGGAAVSRPDINKRDEATTMPRLAPGGRGGHCMQFGLTRSKISHPELEAFGIKEKEHKQNRHHR